MKQSQKALVTGIGVLIAGMVALAGIARIAVSHFDDYGIAAADEDALVVSPQATDLRDFTAVEVRGLWELELRQGDEFSVELRLPEKGAGSRQVYVSDGRLILGAAPDRFGNPWRDKKHDGHPQAIVVMPALAALSITGAGTVDFAGFDSPELRVSVSGAANIQGRDSKAERLKLNISGAGNIDMKQIAAVNADVNLSGAGNIKLGMDGGELSGNVAGMGRVIYYGPVSDVTIKATGMSRVKAGD
ncbi:MAG: DUF2807 domain-containing protein [Gammaproteobacteria bacterium]|nr:DUF2807 domain-containing protein [Gammaproteobacteria bacterium]